MGFCLTKSIWTTPISDLLFPDKYEQCIRRGYHKYPSDATQKTNIFLGFQRLGWKPDEKTLVHAVFKCAHCKTHVRMFTTLPDQFVVRCNKAYPSPWNYDIEEIE